MNVINQTNHINVLVKQTNRALQRLLNLLHTFSVQGKFFPLPFPLSPLFFCYCFLDLFLDWVIIKSDLGSIVDFNVFQILSVVYSYGIRGVEVRHATATAAGA